MKGKRHEHCTETMQYKVKIKVRTLYCPIFFTGESAFWQQPGEFVAVAQIGNWVFGQRKKEGRVERKSLGNPLLVHPSGAVELLKSEEFVPLVSCFRHLYYYYFRYRLFILIYI
jgi:hypothetical protein